MRLCRLHMRLCKGYTDKEKRKMKTCDSHVNEEIKFVTRRKFHHVMWQNPRCVFYLFMGYEFLTADGWILWCVFYPFTGYQFLMTYGWILWYVFLSVYRVWVSDGEQIIFEMCFIYYRVWISDGEQMNFEVGF